LARRQRSEFGLVADEQNPLALLLTETVGDMAMTTFASIDSASITLELPAPALQRGEAHAQKTSDFASPGTGRYGGIQDLQRPAAINRSGQSSSASPQKAWIFFEAYFFAEACGYSNAAASARVLSLRRSSCCSRYSFGEASG
jgi:hypothetical protein